MLLSERATGQLVLATLKDPTVIGAPLAMSLASTILRSDLYAVSSSISYAFPLVLRVTLLTPTVLEITNELLQSKHGDFYSEYSIFIQLHSLDG